MYKMYIQNVYTKWVYRMNIQNVHTKCTFSVHTFDLLVYKMGTKCVLKITVPTKIWIQNDYTKWIQNQHTRLHVLVYNMYTICVQNRVFHCNSKEIIVTKWLQNSHSRLFYIIARFCINIVRILYIQCGYILYLFLHK